MPASQDAPGRERAGPEGERHGPRRPGLSNPCRDAGPSGHTGDQDPGEEQHEHQRRRRCGPHQRRPGREQSNAGDRSRQRPDPGKPRGDRGGGRGHLTVKMTAVTTSLAKGRWSDATNEACTVWVPGARLLIGCAMPDASEMSFPSTATWM